MTRSDYLFRTTAKDLQNCFEALQSIKSREQEQLSSIELTAAMHLTKTCQSILHLLAEVLTLDEIKFDAIVHALPALEKLNQVRCVICNEKYDLEHVRKVLLDEDQPEYYTEEDIFICSFCDTDTGETPW